MWMHFWVAAKQTSRVHSTPSSHSSSRRHSQLERSKTQRPLSQVATMQSASLGPRQSVLRAHSVSAVSFPAASGLGTSGCRTGSGFGGTSCSAGVRGRLGTDFVRGDGRTSSGSDPSLATTAMTKHATASPSARSHQILGFRPAIADIFALRATTLKDPGGGNQPGGSVQ